MNGRWLGTMALVLFFTHAASAGEVRDFTIHQPFVSARALGMGNAFTAVADDYSALFYNPAGLARLKEGQMNFELRAMVDRDIYKFQDDVRKAGSDVQQVSNVLDANMGKHFSARIPTLGWYWVRPKWGVAVIPLDLSVEMDLNRSLGPSAGLIGTQDTTIAFGNAKDLNWFGTRNRLSVGYTVKAIYRGYFNKRFLAADLALSKKLLNDADANEGFTADADVGLLYTPQVSNRGFFKFMRYAKPTFGLTVRNLVDYGFSTNFHLLNDVSGEPPRLQRRVDLGAMFELPDWWIWKTRLAMDLRDMGHSNWSFIKGSHVGVEFLWKVFGWWQGGWRAGLNQGYATLGFTGKMGIFQLDVVTYNEEVGPTDARIESRRYMAKASLDF